jgi:four helix bundle protein
MQEVSKEGFGNCKKHFPPSEKFLLTAQILDASRSITANIAEGHGRYY